MRRDEIAYLLPEIFRRTLSSSAGQPPNVLWALLGVMERLHAPDEEILDHLERYFDPNTLPADKVASFMPFLARWVDMDWVLLNGCDYEAGLGCLRDLILAAPRLAASRGTRQELKEFLEIATGLSGFTIEDTPDLPFNILVTCPSEANRFRALVERIVAGEKPAYVKCALRFSGETL